MSETKKITKHDNVRKHLLEHGEITSWTAIMQYKYTRLSHSIYMLRKDGWQIETEDIQTIDTNGNTCIYAKYKLISTNENAALNNSMDEHLKTKPTGNKTEKKKESKNSSTNHINVPQKQLAIFGE